jgi:hypothetical protein
VTRQAWAAPSARSVTCDRPLKKKKQISRLGAILLPPRFDTISSRRDAARSRIRRRRRKDCDMIGVFIRFRYRDNFDERAVRKIAETARERFEGMPGLRSKPFTVNSGKREAANFYVWDSEQAARAFFTDDLLERVAGLYGVRPSIEFVDVATLVENIRP